MLRLSRYTVLLDACVLYSAALRELLIELASTDLFRAKWTNQIQDEWISALLERRPDIDKNKLLRTAELMELAVLDSRIENYESLIESFVLPDPNDRHVLAAAVHANCDAIITFNLKDFPEDILALHDIELLHPDDFLNYQFDLGEAAVISSVQRIRGRLQRPSMTSSEYLNRLEALGLPKIVAALRRFEKAI